MFSDGADMAKPPCIGPVQPILSIVELLMCEWTGELMIDLRNMRDWSVGDADLTVGRDTVIMRHGGRHLASMDRDHFGTS